MWAAVPRERADKSGRAFMSRPCGGETGRRGCVCHAIDGALLCGLPSQVYALVRPLVESAVHGYNATVFAYGHTSSGKTYTMTGTHAQPGARHVARGWPGYQACVDNHPPFHHASSKGSSHAQCTMSSRQSRLQRASICCLCCVVSLRQCL